MLFHYKAVLTHVYNSCLFFHLLPNRQTVKCHLSLICPLTDGGPGPGTQAHLWHLLEMLINLVRAIIAMSLMVFPADQRQHLILVISIPF